MNMGRGVGTVTYVLLQVVQALSGSRLTGLW